MDEDGQETSVTGDKSELAVPDGWWVARLDNYGTKPLDFLAENDTNLRGGKELEVFGASLSELQFGVTKYRPNFNREGRISSWDYAIIAPCQFVLLAYGIGVGSRPSRRLTIASQVENGAISNQPPNHAHLSFVRGQKGWGWIHLNKVLSALGVSFEDVPLLFWDTIGSHVRLRSRFDSVGLGSDWSDSEIETWLDETHFERSRYRNCLKVILARAKNQVVEVQLPPHKNNVDEYAYYGDEHPLRSLLDLAPDKVLIPAGAAISLVHLFKFVDLEWALEH